MCFVSCRKASDEIPVTEKELPDMILENARYTFGQPGRKPVIMQADKITVMKENLKTELENVTFSQMSEDGDYIEMSGSCDKAVSINNRHATLTGNVKLHKITDQIEIECNELDWDDEHGILKSPGWVRVQYQNGTDMTAKGFTAKLNENVYTFEKLENGIYRSDE